MKESNSKKGGKEARDALDMQLVSEAVIELNVSRRSVGLYPPGHAFITNSINQAYDLLQKLLSHKNSIMLGIAKDSIIVEEETLDKNIPAFKECALSYHVKGIASITFTFGLTKEELVSFLEIMTMEDGPTGAALVELAEKKGLKHIKPAPIDLSSFKFLEGSFREGDGVGYGEAALWREYVTGIMEGKILSNDPSDMIITIPPEEVAGIINDAMSDKLDDESCNRVINKYLRRKGDMKLSPDTINKLYMLIDNLDEGLKQQFLSKTFENVNRDVDDVERMLDELTPDSFKSVTKFFTDFSTMIPNTLKQVIEKLSITKVDKGFSYDLTVKDTPVVHDIVIDENMQALFKEESFHQYASDEYKDNLWEMLRKEVPKNRSMLGKLIAECSEVVVDRVASHNMIEVLESPNIARENYLNVVTRLVEQFGIFVDTGRFEDALNIYNAVYSQSFGGPFKVEASSTLQYVLRSDAFISRLIEAAKVAGRANRESFVRLSRALRHHLITPLLDALVAEENTAHRRFLLTVLSALGSDVVPEALHRLKDKRWYVVRNMIYLIRNCGSPKDVEHIRKFGKYPDMRVCTEAVSTLLKFKTPDSAPYLIAFLRSDNMDLRNQALKLAAAYKVQDAVPPITEMLLKRDMLGADTYNKGPLVTALGRIGDENSLETFMKVMSSKVLLYKDGLRNLKLDVLNNLGGFPKSKVTPILEKARDSKDEEVKALGEKLLRASSGRKKG
jgi:HEAT repeat protein